MLTSTSYGRSRRFRRSQVDSCLSDVENPDESDLIEALGCLGESTEGRAVRVWMRFNETDLDATYGIDNLVRAAAFEPSILSGRQVAT